MSSLPDNSTVFTDYVASLSQLSQRVDPTSPTAQSIEIRSIAESLQQLNAVDLHSLAALVRTTPEAVPVLGLAVGLSREKLKNILRHNLDRASWGMLARERPADVVELLDSQYDLIRLLNEQRLKSYDFADILVARAGTRGTATGAGATGRRVEDEIETVVRGSGLSYATRTRFEGRNGMTAPCDFAIPAGGGEAMIVVAAKGFDSTGSKLTDAVREVEDMAAKRLPRQFVLAVIDGIGWKNRQADLKRIWDLYQNREIDGLYSLARLQQFRDDLESAARRAGLL